MLLVDMHRRVLEERRRYKWPGKNGRTSKGEGRNKRLRARTSDNFMAQRRNKRCINEHSKGDETKPADTRGSSLSREDGASLSVHQIISVARRPTHSCLAAA